MDNKNLYLSKVAKGYDAVARNNLLSIKFERPSLQDISTHALFKLILEDSFKKNLNTKSQESKKVLPTHSHG